MIAPSLTANPYKIAPVMLDRDWQKYYREARTGMRPRSLDDFRRRLRRFRNEETRHNLLLPTIASWYDAGWLTPGQLNQLLSEYWCYADGPCLSWGSARLVPLFQVAGFVTDRPGVTRPTEPLTIYRGAVPHVPQGMSWTTDRKIADLFTMPCDPRSGTPRPGTLAGHTYAVLTATIAPDDVLAVLHAFDQSEVVVDPDGLQGVRVYR